MASPTDIRKGKVIIYNDAPHVILNMQHRTQGRQAGFVQTVMRNLNTGSSTTAKFRSTDSVVFCHTSNRVLEFSYLDTMGFHFLDTSTYEDFLLGEDIIGEDSKFLVENNPYTVLFVNDGPVSLELPNVMELTVESAPDSVRGDTSSSPTKPVTCQNGIVINVPLFVKNGDKIRVKTDDMTYVSRV